MTRRLVPVLPVGLLVLALAGCASSSTPTATSSAAPSSTTTDASPSAAACEKGALPTLEDGTLTIATDKPAYGPWFEDDDPTNGKGYESAVAYAVADQLGYPKDKVTWVTASFNSVVAPGPKPFDVDINQVSITPARKQGLDFSSGYYDVRQAVITTKGSTIADAKSVADLKDAKLGAQVGTTSLTAVNDQIEPSQQPLVFDSNDLAKAALMNGQIDGLVVDLPTAFYLVNAELDDGVIVGQLPKVEGTDEQFGIVLDKGSALTPCVTQAVDALREDGTLDELQATYLTQAGAPELS